MHDKQFLKPILTKYPAAIIHNGSGTLFITTQYETQILILNYYIKEETAPLSRCFILKYSHCVSDDDFITFDHETQIWKKAKINYSTPSIHTSSCVPVFDNVAISFNGKTYLDNKSVLIDDILSFEAEILSTRLVKKQLKEAEKFEEFNSLIQAPDDDFVAWAKNEVLPSYIIYNNKSHTARCTFCGHEFSLDKNERLKRGIQKECPHCQKICTCLPSGNYTIRDTRYAAYADAFSDGMIVRYFELFQMKDEKRYIFEYSRDYYDKNGNVQSYYYDSYKNSGYMGFLPEKVVKKRAYFITPPFKGWTTAASFYFNSRKNLMNTPYKYLFLSEAHDCDAYKELVNSNIYAYIYKSLKYPALESLIKCRNFNIARLIMENNCDKHTLAPFIKVKALEPSPTKALGLSKTIVNRLITAETLTLEMFYEIQRIYERDGTLDDAALDFILKFSPRAEETDLIMSMGKCRKTLNYFLKQQKLDLRLTTRDYYDYLITCRKLGYPLTSDIRFPQHLMAAHDEVTLLYNKEKNEDKNIRFKKLYKELSSTYPELAIDGLLFILPKSPAELTHEGEAQHNCVGRLYINRMLDRKSVVMFLRKADAPNIPYITLEINPIAKSIVQCRYKYNRPCGDDINSIVKKYLKVLHTIIRKPIAA